MKNFRDTVHKYLKQGTIWINKELGTYHVVCYNIDNKIYATGRVVRPKRSFVKEFVSLKSLDNGNGMGYNS